MPKRRFIFNPPPPPPPPPAPTTFEDGYGRSYTFKADTEVRQLYPKAVKEAPSVEEARKNRPWRIDYALVFDGGRSYFTIYYRTYIGAIFAAWWWEHVRSWGGSVILIHES